MEDRTCFGAECCDDGNNRIYPESLGHRAHNRAPASDMLRDHSAAARARALATTLCLIGTCLGVAHAQVVTINSVADLQNIQNNLAGNYVLGGNIDASGFTFAPIGGGAWFTGTLDGSGYTISNLTINDSVDSGVGVFGVIGTGGVVENLGLTNLNVVGSSVGASVGGLTYWNLGTISNVNISGTITSTGGTAGGLAERNDGTISQSSTAGLVTSSGQSAGGLVAFAVNGGSIVKSHAAATVSGGSFVGGLIGENSGGNISTSYATGNVSGGSFVGGLIGEIDSNSGLSGGTITNVYAMGGVSGNGAYIGGLVGLNGSGVGPPGSTGATITNSYATGAVSGGSNVGGLIGLNSSGTITNGYWDIQTTGQATSSSGTGLTTAQLQSGSLPSGFDPKVWSATAGQYPTLTQPATALPIPQLTFPIIGQTAETATTNSVFDHSMRIPSVEVQPYKCDGRVIAYTGELGLVDGWSSSTAPPCINQPGYPKPTLDHQHPKLNAFVVNGAYGGAGTPKLLNYDGHPGIDYRAADGTHLRAAISGTIAYPDSMVGAINGRAYKVFHTLEIIPDAFPDYRIYYLHLSSHPLDFATGRTITVTDASSASCPATVTFPIAAGTHITEGCLVALSGKAGTCKDKQCAPHFHIEVQRRIPLAKLSAVALARVGTTMTCPDDSTMACIPIDPYGWTGAATDCSKIGNIASDPADPASNTALGDYYECDTGLKAVRLWR